MELPVLRGGGKPPCDVCPKRSPENDKASRLTGRHGRALAIHARLKATSGQYRLPGYLAECRWFADLMVAIDRGHELAKSMVYEQAERERSERPPEMRD